MYPKGEQKSTVPVNYSLTFGRLFDRFTYSGVVLNISSYSSSMVQHTHDDGTDRCVFCKIIRKEAPAEILFEDDRTIALLDIRPIHHGHALIIPKVHCIDFLALPQEFLHDVMQTTQIVARALVRTLSLEGFNVFSNNGRVAGQSVFHFHVHVTPRYADDDIQFVLRLKEYPYGVMTELGTRLREKINEEKGQGGL